MKFSSAAVVAILSATGVAAFSPASFGNSNKAATAFHRSPLSASASSTKSISLAMSSTEAEVVPTDSSEKKETFEFTVRELTNHQRMNTSMNERPKRLNESWNSNLYSHTAIFVCPSFYFA
jgi:hypothetical protein